MTFRTELLGSIAATCTTLCWIPQAVKIIRDKHTEGISLITQSFFTLGVGLWAAYGYLLHSWPVLAANIVTFFLSLLVLVLKIRYDSSGIHFLRVRKIGAVVEYSTPGLASGSQPENT